MYKIIVASFPDHGKLLEQVDRRKSCTSYKYQCNEGMSKIFDNVHT